MARIFVSYSRKNKDFCRQLTDELQKRDFDFWVDWEGIPPTVDWKKEIQKGIEEADTFIAIVSPEWIASEICLYELDVAEKNGKRLIPVVPCDIVWDSVPRALAQLNFIFFTEAFDFNEQLTKLFTALDTDYDWLKTHRRLQVKALEWERASKENGFLLRGKDLEDAEQQISVNANKDPHPTDLQREYVLRSRQGSTRQRRITTGILTGLVAGMLGVIVLLTRPYVEDAIAKKQARDLSPFITVPAGRVDLQVYENSQVIDVQKFQIEMRTITNEVYDLCVQVDKCTPSIGSTSADASTGPNDPVVWLTIGQAATYCQWIGRRLPTAAEWELAALQFGETTQNGSGFSLTQFWEWTASYQLDDSEAVTNDWNGQQNELDFKWRFIQQGALIDAAKEVEMYKNTSGALGGSPELGFRCAL
jgi:hypothetical protein